MAVSEDAEETMTPDAKKRKLNSGEGSSSSARTDKSEDKSQSSEEGRSLQQTCSGSETSTKMCDQSSSKGSLEDSSDVSNSKGSGTNGSPEGSSSPTSSFPSKSTTSSDAGRSEQHGQHSLPAGASMTELKKALGSQQGETGGSSEDRRSSDSDEPKDPFSDSGSSASCPSASSAGEKNRTNAQHGGTAGEAFKHPRAGEASHLADPESGTLGGKFVSKWREEAQSEVEVAATERKHRRDGSQKKPHGSEVIDSQTAGDIASLLRLLTQQQQVIIEQQQRILSMSYPPGAAVEPRSLQGDRAVAGTQSSETGSNSNSNSSSSSSWTDLHKAGGQGRYQAQGQGTGGGMMAGAAQLQFLQAMGQGGRQNALPACQGPGAQAGTNPWQ
eukprot:767972-Hanusia_phi.AAC.1